MQLGLATRLSDDHVPTRWRSPPRSPPVAPTRFAARRSSSTDVRRRAAAQFAAERRVIGALVGTPNQVEAVMANMEKRPRTSWTDPDRWRLVTCNRLLAAYAEAAPDRPAITCGEQSITRGRLRHVPELLARDLASRGVHRGDMVTIALPNSIDWFVAQHAIWRVGGCRSRCRPAPTSRAVGDRRARGSARRVRCGAGALPGRTCLPIGYQPTDVGDDVALPDIDDLELASPAWKAPTSGGSTGRPKLIVSGDPAVRDTDLASMLHVRPDECMVMPGPLYHNGPAVWSTKG